MLKRSYPKNQLSNMEEKIIDISKVTANSQTTIPKEVMDMLGLKKGASKILWILEDCKIVIRKA